MNLLYITNGINGSGGLERVLSVKASALAEDFGYQVTILVLNHADQNPFYHFSPKISFRSIEVEGNPIKYWSSYQTGMQRIVNEIQPDVISVCDDGLKAFFIPKFLKTTAKIIYERHVSKLIESRGKPSFSTRAKWWLMESLAKGFDRFVVLTAGNRKEWLSLKNMTVIPNPLPFFPESVSSLDQKTVICVGKISYQKGQDLLAKTWRKVHQQFPDWRLHLYGKENASFLDARTLGNGILFFPPDPHIEQRYQESSIYVMSSRYEGFGMVLIEAMACGLPCVSFNCDYGPSDIIKDGVDGFLVEKENTDEFAEKLMKLIENEDLRKEMGQNARQNVKAYLPEKMVKKWDELFKAL